MIDTNAWEVAMRPIQTLVLSILLLTVTTVGSASACGVSNLWFRLAEHDCSIWTPVGETVTIDVLLETYSLPDAIAEVSFTAAGWIDNPGAPLGTVIENWTADQVAGDLGSGIVLSWDDGLEEVGGMGMTGKLYRLGTIDVTSLDPAWPGTATVFLEDVVYVDTNGGQFETYANLIDIPTTCTFNGYDYCWEVIVDPPDNWFWRTIRYVLPPENEQVWYTIPLSFEVENWGCWVMGRLPYTGTLSLDGGLVAEFSGEGEGNHFIDVDISAVPNGTLVEVEIFVDYGFNATGTVIRHYLVLTTPVEATSFSLVKSLY
jgi:hypothetical protein